MKKVTVIIPVYGVEEYIEKCARSVFEQTYSNLEIIFVDDCTQDNSIEILRRTIEDYPTIKDKTRILSYSDNKGLAGARKFGLENASGDYVLQIDSDDYIAVDMVEVMLSEAEKTDADIVICDMNMISNTGQTHIFTNPSLNPRECMAQVLMSIVHGSVANKMIRRSLYVQNDIWPIQGLDMREDLSVVYRLLYFAKKLAYLPIPFYNYVLREGSISADRMSEKQQNNAQDLIEHMNCFYSKEHIKDESLLAALSFFKAYIKSEILLHGTISLIRNELFKGVRFSHYINHPHLLLAPKIMGLIDSLNIRPLLFFTRSIVDLLLPIKRNFF